jgi:hypothetical protein
MAPDDPTHSQAAPDLFLFSGDGDRVQEDNARPAATPPPEGKPDAATLQHSGAIATRHIIATRALVHRVAGSQVASDLRDAADDEAVTARVLAAAQRARAETGSAGTAADSNHAMRACALEAVRATLGDAIFDACFGGVGAARSSVEQLLRFTVAATSAGPVHAGEWYLFSNAPAYRYKHPAGTARAQMCLCLGDEDGEPAWSGFGTSGKEAHLVRTMVERYNAPRDDADLRWLATHFPDARAIPPAYRDYADQIDADAVVGLDRSTGVALNARTLARLSER